MTSPPYAPHHMIPDLFPFNPLSVASSSDTHAPECALHVPESAAMQADLHLKQPLAPVPRSGYIITVNL
jgi:hypothetical protein